MHAQLLASNSLCTSSCTSSRGCRGKRRRISLRQVRWLVGNQEEQRKQSSRSILEMERDETEREAHDRCYHQVDLVQLQTATRSLWGAVNMACLEPNIHLIPWPPICPPQRKSPMWDGAFLVCFRSHMDRPTCPSSLLAVLLAPPPAPPPRHAPSLLFFTRSSTGTQMVPISKYIICATGSVHLRQLWNIQAVLTCPLFQISKKKEQLHNSESSIKGTYW